MRRLDEASSALAPHAAQLSLSFSLSLSLSLSLSRSLSFSDVATGTIPTIPAINPFDGHSADGQLSRHRGTSEATNSFRPSSPSPSPSPNPSLSPAPTA